MSVQPLGLSLIAALLVLGLTAGCYKPRGATQPLGSPDNPLRMSFVPSTEAAGVLSSGQELSLLLEEQTGLSIEANIATSYVGIVEAMGVGQIQLAWLPPVAYVYASERNGDVAILKVVRKGKASYRGQIVVKADSPVKDVAELRGKRIAFPEQTSASGYYYPCTLLRSAGLDPDVDIEASFTGGHETALLALLHDQADAACSYEDAREKLVDKGQPEIQQHTRILAYTPEIPADNVAVMRDLPAELVDKLRRGLLALSESEAGRQALRELYDIDGLVAAQDSDYEPVREMMRALGQDPEGEARKLDSKKG